MNTEWQEPQWNEWLVLRDHAMQKYFESLQKYINLPASDYLVMRDLRKKIHKRILKLIYTAVAPPENRILHMWQNPRESELDWSDMLEDGNSEENAEGELPALESAMEGIPDEKSVYEALDRLSSIFLIFQDFTGKWSGVLTRGPWEAPQMGKMIQILRLVSEAALHAQAVRFSICSHEQAKTVSLLQYAENKLLEAQELCGQPEISPAIPESVQETLRNLQKEIHVFREDCKMIPMTPEDWE